MNIKDFLIDNYIWILVIILVTIITIIGFLADKKKSGNNNSKAVPQANPNMGNGQVVNNGTMQYQQPMQNQQIIQNQMNNANNMGMNYNGMNSVGNLNQVQPQNVGMVNNQPTDNLNNQNIMSTEPQPVQVSPSVPEMVNSNPLPVENVTPNVNPEPMYQPLSEQKPVIPPQPVPNFQEPQIMNNQELLQGGLAPIDNNQNQSIPNQNIPTVAPNMMSTQGMQQTTMPSQNMQQISTYNTPTPMPQPIENNNNNGMIQNFVQNNTTIPQPVNPIPAPQPVNPQPIMTNTYNPSPVMPQNYQQPMANPQQVVQQPQQTFTAPQQPVNFVFGPQNNNQSM